MKSVSLGIAGVITVILIVVLLSVGGNLIEYNKFENWQLVQGVSGNVRIVDLPGYYGQYFGNVTTYPRTLEAFYSSHIDEGDGSDKSITVTFNDGGTAQVSSYLRIQLPVDEEHRKLIHRDFQGNPLNIKVAMRAHLVNAIKMSGPTMSASENQSARKAEFNQIVGDQMIKGLFKMRRTEQELSDLTEMVEAGVDDKGNKLLKEKKARVLATEIVYDDKGQPIVIEKSPLEHYGIQVLQFSITEIDYDKKTLEQFAAKKESYLNAEKSKAQRQEEVQQRLMIEERGRRQVAEVEAKFNQEKTQAVIQAEMAQEVAEVNKKKAVTEAEQRVEVALQLQKETDTLKQIAAIKAETAELDKKAQISLAEAKKESLEKGGSFSERERGLAEIEREKAIGVARELSKIASPGVVIMGGSDIDGKSSGGLQNQLLSMVLLRHLGAFDVSSPAGGMKPVSYTQKVEPWPPQPSKN